MRNLTAKEAKRKLQSLIEEFFFQEDLSDKDNYSIKLAELAFEWLKKDRKMQIRNFVDICQNISTSFFIVNQVRKKELLQEVGKRIKNVFSSYNVSSSEENRKYPEKVFIEDIDSFEKVKNVDRLEVLDKVPVELQEKKIKRAIREIIGEPFEQTDWSGEQNDLFSSAVTLKGERVDTAFMLKGPGTKGTMQIGKAGKRGDQIQRLFESPADLFIIQYVRKMEDRFVKHIKQKAKVTKAKYFCIIDGTDTARLLEAYGYL